MFHSAGTDAANLRQICAAHAAAADVTVAAAVELPGRPDRPDRPDRLDRPGGLGQPGRLDRLGRLDKSELPGQQEQREQPALQVPLELLEKPVLLDLLE